MLSNIENNRKIIESSPLPLENIEEIEAQTLIK